MCSNHASEMRRLRSSLVKLRRRGAAAVLVDQNQMVQESARVNLAERFLRGVVGELPERPGSFRAVVVLLARRNFPAGSFVEIFEIEAAAPRRLARENHSRLHRVSKFSRTWSSLASMRRRICGSILSLIDTAKRTASKVADFVLKPKASWSAAKRDFASGVQSTWNCTAGVFLGYAMMFNEVKYLADGGEIGVELRSLPACA